MPINLLGKAVSRVSLPTVQQPSAIMERVYAQQGDINSRIIKIFIYDQRGRIDLTPYNKVRLSAVGKSGVQHLSDGVISQNGKYALCALSENMLIESGKLMCNVVFSNTVDDNIILTSGGFEVIILGTYSGSGEVNNENLNSIIRMMAEIDSLIKRADDTIDDIGSDIQDIRDLCADKVGWTDSNLDLNTTDKTLLGAINEIANLPIGASGVIVSKPTYLEFPTVGNPIAVYVDTSENAIYRWDDANLKYYCVGRDYKEIEIINGGSM